MTPNRAPSLVVESGPIAILDPAKRLPCWDPFPRVPMLSTPARCPESDLVTGFVPNARQHRNHAAPNSSRSATRRFSVAWRRVAWRKAPSPERDRSGRAPGRWWASLAPAPARAISPIPARRRNRSVPRIRDAFGRLSRYADRTCLLEYTTYFETNSARSDAVNS
jgi:hypothetical protein